MLKLPKPAAIAIQATLGIALSASWAVSALATEAFGGFQSAGFPVAMVDGPITLPPVNVRPQTSPSERSDHPPGGATPGGPTEGSDHPPGDLGSAGQPNQSPTAQSINQTRQVRPVNPTRSTSGSTRPARILPSQQGTGPLQQGTGTDQTIGVPQLRPALVLPLQRDTVFNQTVLPLQQGTSTNPTIAVPQVRPVLALPQGTVQTALPLPLQQGTGTNQKIGIGQVRPANAGTSMRAQGVIGKGL